MQKGVILGYGNRSNAGMDTVTLDGHYVAFFLMTAINIQEIVLSLL
jgi:hypothetical protein